MNQTALIFAAYAGPYEGNFIPSLRLLSQELAQQDTDTVLILLEQVRDYAWVSGIDWCREILFLGNHDRQNIAGIARIMKENNIRFVYTHFAESRQLLQLKAAMVLAGKKIPMVDHLHARLKPLGNPAKQWVKNALWRGDYLIGCSRRVEQDVRECGMKNICTSVDNAIDFSRFPQAECTPRQPNILMFGYNVHIKGVDIALEACGRLAPEFPRMKLQICAATGAENVAAEIQSRFGSMPDWVEILPPAEDVGRYYAQSLAYLCASREEGFCYAVVEAAYCNTLVVSSRIDGPLQIDIPNIRWFASENPEELASRLREVLSMPREEAMAQAARMHTAAADNYSICRWTAQIVTFLEEHHLIGGDEAHE